MYFSSVCLFLNYFLFVSVSPLFVLYPTTHTLEYCMYVYLFPHTTLFCVLSITRNKSYNVIIMLSYVYMYIFYTVITVSAQLVLDF